MHGQKSQAAKRVCREYTKAQGGKNGAKKHHEAEGVFHGGIQLLTGSWPEKTGGGPKPIMMTDKWIVAENAWKLVSAGVGK